MLPQFGYIVAQAGADYYSLPRSPPPSSVPQTSSTSIVTQQLQPQQQQQPTLSQSQSQSQQPSQQQQQSNGSIPALAPLLNNKPFGFTGSGVQSSSSTSSSNDNYYKSNTSNGNFNTPPYYSRQPSPSPGSSNIPILPPPSFLYSAVANKEIIPKAGFQQPNVLPILDKKKDSSWYSPLPPPPSVASVPSVPHANNIPTPTHHYHHQHQHQSPQPLPPPPQQQPHHLHSNNQPLYHIRPNSPPQRVDSPFYDHPIIEDDRNVQPINHSSKWQGISFKHFMFCLFIYLFS